MLYGRRVGQSEILTGKVKAPAAAEPLMKELERYFRRNPSDEPPPSRVK
jgi:lipid-binding SYLF domain-containing protein